MSQLGVTVVTGANRGLGLEVGRQFKGTGVDVVPTARDAEKARLRRLRSASALMSSMSLPRQCESRAIVNINGVGLELPT